MAEKKKKSNQIYIDHEIYEDEEPSLMLTKSNDLIHAKFSASLFVQKLINYSFASIRKMPNGDLVSEVRISDIIKAMDLKGKSAYTQVSLAVKPILNFKIIKFDDVAEEIIGINVVTDCHYKDGTLRTTFNKKIEADVIDIKKRFTKNNVIYLSKFNSAYSLRLYELLSTHRWSLEKSAAPSMTVKYSLGELRFEMGTIDPDDNAVQKAINKNVDWNVIAEDVATNRIQKSWDTFKRRALLTAQEEINNADYSDLGFDFEPVKGSHNKVIAVKFKIYLKNPPKKKKENLIPVEEIEAVDVRLVSDIRDAFAGYPLKEEELIALVRAAGNNRQRIEKAIELVKTQKKPIKNLMGFLVAAIQQCWDLEDNIPYIAGESYEGTQQTLFEYTEHEKEHDRLNALVDKYLANDIKDGDIDEDDLSIVMKMAKAAKKVKEIENKKRARKR